MFRAPFRTKVRHELGIIHVIYYSYKGTDIKIIKQKKFIFILVHISLWKLSVQIHLEYFDICMNIEHISRFAIPTM